jgi:hypothetical protein
MSVAARQVEEEALERSRARVITANVPKISESEIQVGSRIGKWTVVGMPPRPLEWGSNQVLRDEKGRIICYGCGGVIRWASGIVRDESTGRVTKSAGAPPRWCDQCKSDGKFARRRSARVRCDCGTVAYRALPMLAAGDSSSCGCWKRESTSLRNEVKSTLWGVRYREALVSVLIYAGLRPQEVRVLRWRDVDFDAGFLRVRGAWRGIDTRGAPRQGARSRPRAPGTEEFES